jgi:iron(III) transport system permease protein
MLLGQGQALAAALGVWTMVFLGTSLLVASTLLGRRLGALFRV